MKKLNLLTLVALSLIGANVQAPVLAAVTGNDVVNTVEKAKILAAGTRVAAAINGTEVYISTYKNARATDNDCKIEAVLMAKAAMDLSSDLTRATVYFYSTANINKRKFVSVTAGDVKAFGSGQLGQEQLLSSLAVKDEEVNDPAARLNSYLQQRETLRSRRTFDTQMSGSTMIVTADVDAGTSDRDLKFEAFRIAERALDSSSGSGAKSVQVNLTNPATRGTIQQITFEEGQVKSINNSIQSALSSIQVAAVASKVDVQNLSTGEGDEKESRDKILAMIKNLDKNGVGVSPFLRPFYELEQLAAGDDAEKTKAAAARLLAALTEQEARSKDAKNFKPVGKEAPKEAPKAISTPEDTSPDSSKKSKTSRWAGGASALTDGEILNNVDQALENQANAMGGRVAAEKDKKFGMVLVHAYEVLNAHGRTADAEKVMNRYKELRARNNW